LLVNLDVAAADLGAGIPVVGLAHLVVIDDRIAVVLVPDLDAEQVHVRAGGQLRVGGGQHEAIVAAAVDRAHALVLGPGPGDDQPVVARGVEVQVSGLELELGLAGGRSWAGGLEFYRGHGLADQRTQTDIAAVVHSIIVVV